MIIDLLRKTLKTMENAQDRSVLRMGRLLQRFALEPTTHYWAERDAEGNFIHVPCIFCSGYAATRRVDGTTFCVMCPSCLSTGPIAQSAQKSLYEWLKVDNVEVKWSEADLIRDVVNDSELR